MLDELPTPCLLLDRATFRANCARMATKMSAHGVDLRPHMKTAKSVDAAREATRGNSGAITVSTLAEAEYFADHGFADIVYAVGAVPQRIPRLAQIQRRTNASITVIVDDPRQVNMLGSAATRVHAQVGVLIEVDTGGRRGGVAAQGDLLLEVAHAIVNQSNLELRGVLTHAGQSYQCEDVDQIARVAQQERDGVVAAAARVRETGLPCPVVSAGSTPTAVHIDSLEGVTEMRPGVYMFGDLAQCALGSCRLQDIAVTVLTTVIGHNRRAGLILTDGGGLALSKDVSGAALADNVGYGWVRDAGGELTDMYVAGVHQEHGLLASRSGAPAPFERFPIGSRVQVLPNHICMTAAAHDRYYVTDTTPQVTQVWDRCNGW